MTAVNGYFVDRLVALGETSHVEAHDDIVSQTGIKLVAKGSRIDSRTRERLLEHKLKLPIERSIRVLDGVSSRRMDRIAEALLDEHPLMAQLCGTPHSSDALKRLKDLRLGPAIDSLLTMFAALEESSLRHAVGVAMLASSFADTAPTPMAGPLLMAGLLHDVGNLYLDPTVFQSRQLTPAQWRQIASHPVIGCRVLQDIPEAGARVAAAVLQHHERADGFGYPQSIGGTALSLEGQVLALSEALVGVCAAPEHAGLRAWTAVQLVPGEFDRGLCDRVARASAAVRSTEVSPTVATDNETADVVARASKLVSDIERLREAVASWLASAPTDQSALGALVGRVAHRMERLRIGLMSAGLHGAQADLQAAIANHMDAAQHLEAKTIIGELGWRVRELQREIRRRSEAIADDSGSVSSQLARKWLAHLEQREALGAPASPPADTK